MSAKLQAIATISTPIKSAGKNTSKPVRRARRLIPPRRRLKPIPRAPGIRGEVASWSREKLLEFALEVIDSHKDIRQKLEKLHSSKGDIKSAVDRLKAQIDRDLLIDYVGWKELGEFVDGLEDTLTAIKALGERSPKEALDLVWHFIDEIPSIFESVHDECQLGMFCDKLMESAAGLTRAAGASELELGSRLLDVHIADMHEYCKFDDAPKVLLEARLSRETREALAELVKEKAKGRSEYDRKELLGFAGKLLRQRTG